MNALIELVKTATQAKVRFNYLNKPSLLDDSSKVSAMVQILDEP